jgi:hypothetical protein
MSLQLPLVPSGTSEAVEINVDLQDMKLWHSILGAYTICDYSIRLGFSVTLRVNIAETRHECHVSLDKAVD